MLYDLCNKFMIQLERPSLDTVTLLFIFCHNPGLFGQKKINLFFKTFFSRVSIIRGRVITMSGQGIIGVRVSVDRTRDATNYGFTLTRPGGW